MLEKLPDVIGNALQGRRAGLEKILFNKLPLREGTGRLELSSLAFKDHGALPARYTADGEGHSPALSWKNVPTSAVSLVLIVEDADSPTPEPLVHLIAVDIDRTRDGVAENELLEEQPEGSVNLGRNSYLRQSWLPPDPPPGHGPHRYAFQLFALTAGEPFAAAPGRGEIAAALGDRAIASGCLIGIYERDNTVKTDDSQTAAAADLQAPSAVAI